MARVFVCDECVTAAFDAGATMFGTQIALCVATGDKLRGHECNDRTACACACSETVVVEVLEYARQCIDRQRGFDG